MNQAKPNSTGSKRRRPEGGRGRRQHPNQQDVPAERLHKVLAHAGFGSLREMEAAILAGRVTVNGKLAEPGQPVKPSDRVRMDGHIVKLPFEAPTSRVIIYHKPEGEVVTTSDPEGRPTVFDRMPKIKGAKWNAIGRLDFNTEGLLILTTDGGLANRMMHPRYGMEREYAVRVLGEITEEIHEQLIDGVTLDDGIARFDSVEDAGGEGANRWYRVVLKEGRNREVRRMFEAVGLTVSRLIRTRFGPVALPPQLKRGQFRELGADEVAVLGAISPTEYKPSGDHPMQPVPPADRSPGRDGNTRARSRPERGQGQRAAQGEGAPPARSGPRRPRAGPGKDDGNSAATKPPRGPRAPEQRAGEANGNVGDGRAAGKVGDGPAAPGNAEPGRKRRRRRRPVRTESQ